MVLLEFHYWTDVVMWGIVITAICSVAILVIAVKMLKRLANSDDDERAKELEAQMDGWLLTLKQSIGKLETVSDKVDSKK